MNRLPNIAAIVEGDGDVAAVPGLLRRILGSGSFVTISKRPIPNKLMASLIC